MTEMQTIHCLPPGGAQVIPFPRRRGRGRPKAVREEKDFGTPELQARRLRGETAEALDLCLERGLITPQQHWCGIHLRWLYTLRYGAPGVRALDLNEIAGDELACDDPTWRELREAEYNEAVAKLAERRLMRLLIDICVHNERPGFLARPDVIARRGGGSLYKFRDGLDVLVRHWERK